MNRDRNYSFDIIKIVATILILLHHYQQYFGTHYQGINFYGGKFYFGWVVELFFILSGFFMSRYVDRIQKGVRFRDYFFKRYFRLMPVMAIAAIVFQILNSILILVRDGSFERDGYSFWSTVTAALGIHVGWGFDANHLAVNNPTWYIGVLLACYVWFFFLTWISGRTGTSPWIWYGVFVLIGVWGYSNNITLPLFTPSTARGIYSFFFGLVFSACIQKTIDENGRLNYNTHTYIHTYTVRFGIYLFVALILLGIPLLIEFFPHFMDEGMNFIMTYIYFPVLLFTFSLRWARKTFHYAWIGTLAGISFNVYIWHSVGLMAFDLLITAGLITYDYRTRFSMLLYVLAMYVIGTLSYFFIEQPIKNLMGKILEKT